VSIISSGCAALSPEIDTTEPTLISSQTPLKSHLATHIPSIPASPAITNDVIFEIIFDGNDCSIVGSNEVFPGNYMFSLTNNTDQKVDIAVTHLIDKHTYQDLLAMQSVPGEPFVKEYWMSQPSYFTKDHQVWNYSLDVTGEHAVLILKHVFEGAWICGQFDVIEDPDG
jgi:hypothetical protein